MQLFDNELAGKQELFDFLFTKGVKFGGGLGASLYIKGKVLEWCEGKNIAAVFPESASHMSIYNIVDDFDA